MEHLRFTPIFNSDVQTLLQAELAAAAGSAALRPWVLHPEPDLGPRFVGYWRALSALPRSTRRSLQRQWKKSLGAIALLMALGQAPVLAATINVSGACTLARAITAANTDAPVGGCPAGSGADTLVLAAGSTHTRTTVANTTFGPTGLPLVTTKITIEGNGGTIQRGAGAPAFRLLAVSAAGILNLQDVTLTGGQASDGSCCSPIQKGGGVANYGGTLTLTNCTVSGNAAGGFDPSNNGYQNGDGGGIFNAGTLIVARSGIFNNHALSPEAEQGNDPGNGGGLLNTGIATLTDSRVSGNFAQGGDLGACGGGVATSGRLTVSGSTISDNSAGGYVSGGGGICGGPTTLTNSTVSGNRAGYGGGLLARTLTLTNSTVTGNETHYSDGPFGVVTGAVSAHSLTLSRSLISGNTADDGTPVEVATTGGSVVANAFNVFGTNGDPGISGFSPGAMDIVPAGPLSTILAPLAENGGPSRTHALVAGSPAVDAVVAGCPPPDQRGFTRPVDGDGDGVAACDSGAFERGASAPPTCATATPTSGCTVNGVANRLCRGTTGNDRISGTNGADVIFGLGGNDGLDGLSGNDLLCGGPGNDTLQGKDGHDRIFGEAGNDNLQGGNGIDQLAGAAGNDQLLGENGDDALDGGTNTDNCNGGANGTAGDTAGYCETVVGIP